MWSSLGAGTMAGVCVCVSSAAWGVLKKFVRQRWRIGEEVPAAQSVLPSAAHRRAR